MRYLRVDDQFVATDGEASWALNEASPSITTFSTLAEAAAITDTHIDEIAQRHCTPATRLPEAYSVDQPDRPVDPDEVWAAGVTYRISEEARESESGLPEIYQNVYEAERPELFFKATASRTVGPGDQVGIRGDSDWDVPEPELAIVLYRDRIVGYTIGNDMSSRDLEGANPLYLPQAKIYDQCCAIGPCIASTRTVSKPRELSMELTIKRNGTMVYSDSTSTAELVRSPRELVSYYANHNTVPKCGVLLTGTSLVPPDEFSLQPGDAIAISIDQIGRLQNDVVEV